MKITGKKIIALAAVLLVLAAAFWWGGNAPGLQGWQIEPRNTAKALPEEESAVQEPSKEGLIDPASAGLADAAAGEEASPDLTGADGGAEEPGSAAQMAEKPKSPAAQGKNRQEEAAGEKPGAGKALTAEEKVALASSLAGNSSPGVEKGSASYSEEQGMQLSETTGKDKYLTDPVPEGKPLPVEPQETQIGETAYTCTLSVRCDTILENIGWLDPEKVELVPEDGVVFPSQEVTFYEGESVFNVLQREMKKAKIHMEFVNTPMYNSAYIEGINNLYEFDCGELSGWMYKVNDWFPNYGCSRYQLKDGDLVEWVYTCDLGVDVGGFYATGS